MDSKLFPRIWHIVWLKCQIWYDLLFLQCWYIILIIENGLHDGKNLVFFDEVYFRLELEQKR